MAFSQSAFRTRTTRFIIKYSLSMRSFSPDLSSPIPSVVDHVESLQHIKAILLSQQCFRVFYSILTRSPCCVSLIILHCLSLVSYPHCRDARTALCQMEGKSVSLRMLQWIFMASGVSLFSHFIFISSVCLCGVCVCACVAREHILKRHIHMKTHAYSLSL